MRTACVLLGLTFAALRASSAAEYYVDQAAGDDANDGSQTAPFKTITQGALSAQAGDTVHVNPTGKPYRETVDLYKMKSGEPGNPITIDGHGVTVSGAEPCSPDGWRRWKDDVVVRDDFPWKCAICSSARFKVLFIIDGRLALETTAADVLQPGEFCFMPNDANRLLYFPMDSQMPEIEVGQPDGSSVKLDPKAWQAAGYNSLMRYNGLQAPTWLKRNGVEVPLVTAIDRLEPGQFTVAGKELYFRLPAGKTVADLSFEAVVRDNGIQVAGTLEEVVIKNFNVTHVANDGYNIHGSGKQLTFSNCNATQCGDEGFSAHETAETLLDGGVFTECDNGIANINRTVSVVRNVVIAGCRGQGFGGDSDAQFTVENLILIDNGSQLSSANVSGKNILIANVHKESIRDIVAGGSLKGVTLIGKETNQRMLEVAGGKELALTNCRFEKAGILYIRDSDQKKLAITDSLFHPDTVVEWGAAQPFKTVKLTDAATDQSFAFSGVGFIAEPLLDPLLAGNKPQTMPSGPGCTPALIDRYLSFMANDKTETSHP